MPQVSIYFEPRDIWIGVYWTKQYTFEQPIDGQAVEFLYVYICIVPMLPIRLKWRLGRRDD